MAHHYGVKFLHEAIRRFERTDDVWSKAFLSNIVLQFSDAELFEQFSLQPDLEMLLKDWGNRQLYFTRVTDNVSGPPEGPYFLKDTRLHAAYRLYPDTAGAFVVSTVPSGDDPHQSAILISPQA